MSRHIESNLQIACVRWFDMQHREISALLYAVPNGGYRNAREAARFKAEGVRSGVPDLCLAVSNGRYGALYIEMKSDAGRVTPLQKKWQEMAEKSGNRCVVVRSLEQFIEVITDYLP